jgi:hypothetical protein
LVMEPVQRSKQQAMCKGGKRLVCSLRPYAVHFSVVSLSNEATQIRWCIMGIVRLEVFARIRLLSG